MATTGLKKDIDKQSATDISTKNINKIVDNKTLPIPEDNMPEIQKQLNETKRQIELLKKTKTIQSSTGESTELNERINKCEKLLTFLKERIDKINYISSQINIQTKELEELKTENNTKTKEMSNIYDRFTNLKTFVLGNIKNKGSKATQKTPVIAMDENKLNSIEKKIEKLTNHIETLKKEQKIKKEQIVPVRTPIKETEPISPPDPAPIIEKEESKPQAPIEEEPTIPIVRELSHSKTKTNYDAKEIETDLLAEFEKKAKKIMGGPQTNKKQISKKEKNNDDEETINLEDDELLNEIETFEKEIKQKRKSIKTESKKAKIDTTNPAIVE